MKSRRLSAQGFAHHLVLAVIVVGVAAVGTYALIASHADTCDVSAPVTSAATYPVTNPTTCAPVTAPVTAPVSSPTPTPTPPTSSAVATCTIAMASSVPTGSKVSPVLTFKNNGQSTINGLKTTKILFATPDGINRTLPGVTINSLRAGVVRTFKLGSQPVGTVAGKGKLSVRAVAGAKLVVSCNKTIVLTAATNKQ